MGIDIRLEGISCRGGPIVRRELRQSILSPFESSHVYGFVGNRVRIPKLGYSSDDIDNQLSLSRPGEYGVVVKCRQFTIVVPAKTVTVGNPTVGAEYNFILHNINKNDSALTHGFDAGRCTCVSKDKKTGEYISGDGRFHLILGADNGYASVSFSGLTAETYGENACVSIDEKNWNELLRVIHTSFPESTPVYPLRHDTPIAFRLAGIW